METKDTVDTKAAMNTENARSTRARLDELRGLYKDEYITEYEFKIARVNILKEGGVDVVTQLQQYVHQQTPIREELEEEEPKGSGCGCFLLALLLLIFLVLGVSFFAAPYWPDQYGGDRAREARKWFIVNGTALVDRFFGDASESIKVPDPVVDGDERLKGDSIDVEGLGLPEEIQDPSGDVYPDNPAELPNSESGVAVPPSQATPSGELTAGVALPPIVHILSQPESTGESISTEPDITVAEMETPLSTENNSVLSGLSANLGVENTIRGYVTGNSTVRIRSEPDTSTDSNIVDRLNAGNRLTVLEEGPGRDGSKWYRVEYENGNKSGWIKGTLVKLE